MPVTISSTNFNGNSATVKLYHPTGTTIPYSAATFTNIGEKTIPFTYTSNILDYGTFECSFISPSKVCTTSELAGPDGDGNYYRTIKIGNQVWMSESLRTTKFSNGTPLDNPGGAHITNNTTWSNANGSSTRYWSYVNGDSANTAIYGLLYNQFAIFYPPSGASLCPSGWRVSSESDVNTLANSLGGLSVAANALKYPGTQYWTSGNFGNNSSGFNSLGSGYRRVNGSYGFKDTNTLWTTSTYIPWDLFYLDGTIYIYDAFSSVFGFSVRCIKN